MKRATLFLAVLACTLLVPLAAGQVTLRSVALDEPLTYLGTYSLKFDRISPSVPPPPDCAVIYDNISYNGNAYLQGPDILTMDWGTLAAFPNNQICRMWIGYYTTLDTTEVRVGLHQGTTGWGDPGVPLVFVNFSGLPGPGSFAFDVDLSILELVIPDGPIGYSYEVFDNFTGPVTVGPPNAPGVEDALDMYDAVTMDYITPFYFGGQPMASYFLQLLGQPPLAVDLLDMSAVYDEGAARVCWTTGAEIDSVGFRVHVGGSPYGPFSAVTGLIPAMGSPTQGFDYCITDDTFHVGPTPWYQLEDIGMDGVSTYHDPVRTAGWPAWRRFIPDLGSAGFGLN
jgi:hypothetical protein